MQDLTDNQKIATLANLELAIHGEKFKGVYLLSEEGAVMQKEEAPGLAIDLESLKTSLLHAVKVVPDFSEFLLNSQGHRIVILPLSVTLKGGITSIPGVSFIVLILPPTKAYRKEVNDFIRNLLAPFIKKEEKPKAKKKEMDDEAQKRLAQKVLDELDEI